jgi:hypothetical protein
LAHTTVGWISVELANDHQDGRLRDHARHEHGVLGPLDVFPEAPLVLVTRVGGFERVGAGSDSQHDVDHVLELHVVDARAHVDAVAGVKADPVPRDVAQRVI